MANERLRSALTTRGLTARRAAEQLDVDPKTVERWIAGRVPHRSHRQKLAGMLAENETYLWPEADSGRELTTSQAELVTLYPHRSDVPRDVWRRLLSEVAEQLDVLVYAGLFLREQFPDLTELLRGRLASGCQIRVALGDPDSDAVRLRGIEERYGDGIDSRARVVLKHYQPLLGTAGFTLATHGTTLYNSIYRFDDEILVSPHLWGANAYLAPVLHLRRVAGGTLFTTYVENFEAVWATATRLHQS